MLGALSHLSHHFLQLIVLLPTLARRWIEEGITGFIIRDLPRFRIEFHRSSEALSDYSKIEYLSKLSTNAKRRTRLFFALAG